MTVSTKHPDYTTERINEWRLMRDAFDGESSIKKAGEKYLVKPSGYSKVAGHDDGGFAAYSAYKSRAQFAEILAPSIGSMLGIIHGQNIEIEMPAAMEYLRENADGNGGTLDEFHRLISKELLLMGRYGVLADAPDTSGPPFLAGYQAEKLINWDVDFFVLDETGMVRSGYAWESVEQYRVLRVEDGSYVQTVIGAGAETDMTPTGIGGALLQSIPFVLAGARGLSDDVETPPLIGVARAALAMYQLSADYRLQLYMSGQETLVAINGGAPQSVGAGVVHEMYGAEGVTPDLKYVSPDCAGIAAHLEAININKESAAQAGARLFEQAASSQESGDARRLRFKSETANIQTVAQSSCAALEGGLRGVADLLGLNRDEVIVSAPEDLLDATITPQDAKTLWEIASTGGMSWETYYRNLQAGGIASPDADADEEYSQIEDREFGNPPQVPMA